MLGNKKLGKDAENLRSSLVRTPGACRDFVEDARRQIPRLHQSRRTPLSYSTPRLVLKGTMAEEKIEEPTHLDILMAEAYKSTHPDYEAAECKPACFSIADLKQIELCRKITEISDEVPVQEVNSQPKHHEELMAGTHKFTRPQYQAAERRTISIVYDAGEQKVPCEKNSYSTTEISDEVPVQEVNSEPQPHADALTCEATVSFRNWRSREDSAGLADASDKLRSHSSSEQQDTIQVADDAPQEPTYPDPKKNNIAQAAPISKGGEIMQDFLHTLRFEESLENEARKIAKKKRCMSIKFFQVIETAEKELNSAEEGLKVLYNAKSISIPGPAEEVGSRERHMEETLATASVQVASLLAANYCDKLDYVAATEPIIALTKSVRSIMDDGSVISSTLYEKARKSFIEDMLGLCEATIDIYEAARSNNEKLNDAAMAFGKQTVKLLGVVSSDVNTTLETELISRAKAVSDTACHLIQEVSDISNNTDIKGDSQDISTVTERCVDAAEKLVYTAKVVAPTIQYSTCQDALVSSADSLSTSLTTFLNTWKALTSAQKPNIRKLTQDGENLEALVENLRNDVKTGKLGKRVQEEEFVTGDVPLRHVAKKITVCHKADGITVNTNSQSASKRPAYDEAPGQLDTLHNGTRPLADEVIMKKVYVRPLDSSTSSTIEEPKVLCQTLSYSTTEAGAEAEAKEDNIKPTHLDLLLGKTNDTIRPRYELLCERLDSPVTTIITPAIPEVGILNEKNSNDDMVACVKPDIEMTLDTSRFNGQQVEVLEDSTEKYEDTANYNVEKEFDTASKWLSKCTSNVEVKTSGQQAVRNLIAVANKITEDLNDHDKEDMRHLITETELVLAECIKKYDHNQYSVLMERVRELKKGIERGMVTRVVENFMESEIPLADLDIIAGHERDERKRKLLLEKKISELLAHLSRFTKTARLIADTRDTRDTVSTQLNTYCEQAELLASMLAEVAQQRATSPDDTVVINHYKSLFERYAESLSKIRDLCDQSVDPMNFVQTAGETMRRMREESLKHNDILRCAHTSSAITKLGRRVIHVSMSSSTARSDPELQKALLEAEQQMIAATTPADFQATSEFNWQHATAQILRATEEVEALLSGETIFKEKPETHQPIYVEALNLHAAVRDWSSRDNEIVAAAKRMAVLMAKLSNFMNNDKQREVLATSKSIVTESHEVVRLAKKLAHECPDRRIKTNLLQACERIPTVSAQLKMLTTVKATSLGRYGIREDKDAMDMLVGNAQSLMLSIQYVVKGAAGASVKIMSQRGLRMKWVRKTMC